MKKHKTNRKQGAPLGNRNAVKHGRFTQEKRVLVGQDHSFYANARLSLKMLEKQFQNL